MKLLDPYQYKYIEKCLYNYEEIKNSNLETEKLMLKSINMAIDFFKGTIHYKMMDHFYFKASYYRKKYTVSGHFRYVCSEIINTEEPNGYVIRREIVYRVAMGAFSLGLFKMK